MYTLTYPDGKTVELTENEYQTIINALGNAGNDCEQVVRDERVPRVVRDAMRESRKTYWGLSSKLNGDN